MSIFDYATSDNETAKHHVKVGGCAIAIKISTWNPWTPLRERLQTTVRLLSGVKVLLILPLNLMPQAHPPTFT